MLEPPPAPILDAARRLQTSCRCMWTDADRNVVTAWLADRLMQQPPGFPVRLEQRGSTWWLEPA